MVAHSQLASTDLPSLVAAVVAAGPDHPPQILAATPWLATTEAEPLALYASFSEQFSTVLFECSRILGPPREAAYQAAPSWYPECIRFASWLAGANIVYLAVVHHDRETPVLLELGIVSPTEIASRAG